MIAMSSFSCELSGTAHPHA